MRSIKIVIFLLFVFVISSILLLTIMLYRQDYKIKSVSISDFTEISKDSISVSINEPDIIDGNVFISGNAYCKKCEHEYYNLGLNIRDVGYCSSIHIASVVGDDLLLYSTKSSGIDYFRCYIPKVFQNTYVSFKRAIVFIDIDGNGYYALLN